MGYLDRSRDTSLENLKAAIVFGSVVASFTVEDFSVNGLLRATETSMAERYDALATMTRIEQPVSAHVYFENHTLITEGV